MPADLDLAAALHARGALLEGHFRLSSGRHSNRFVQKFRLLEHPPLVEAVARALADAFRTARPTVVVSSAVGGIILGYEVARQLGVDAIFVEKENGVSTLRRSFSLRPTDRALVVEDVVTTGMSVGEVLDIVRTRGAQVIGVGAIVQRAPVEFGVPTRVLLELPIESFEPETCPQCKAGEPVSDPGSRRAGQA
jgi:orotate phosphoribosyltransferase